MSDMETIGMFCKFHANELERISSRIFAAIPSKLLLNSGNKCATTQCKNPIERVAVLEKKWFDVKEVY